VVSAGSAGGRWRFDALDQFEVEVFELRIVVVGVLADEGQGLPVIFGSLTVIAAGAS